MTNYIVTVEIGDLFTLTPGAGVTMGGELGTVVVILTAAQSLTALAGPQHWTFALNLIGSPDPAILVFRGTLIFRVP
jgi:hypothetical protein